MRVIKVITFLLLLFHTVLPAEAAGRFYPYGEVKWSVDKVGKLSTDMTITDNGLLYCPVGNKISCYNLNSGLRLWERKVDVGGKITEPLVIQDGTVYATGTDGIQQMKPNGNTTWVYRVYPKPKGTKSIGVVSFGPSGLVFLGLADGLYALEPQKNYQWRYSDDKNVVALLGDDDAVYVCTGDKDNSYSLRAIDKSGDRIWHAGLGDIKNVQMVFGPDSNLYVITNPAKLDRTTSAEIQCLDKKTGKELWNFSLKSDDLTKLNFTKENDLVFCGGNRMYFLKSDGTQQWSLPLLNVVSGVAVDNEKQRLYAGSTDGRIFCVGFNGRLIWDKEIDKTTGQTLAKGGGIMVDTGKDEKDTITREPVMLKDGGILVYTDKGKLYKFVDVDKEL